MKRFRHFTKDLTKKEFWKFSFRSKIKIIRFFSFFLLATLATVYVWIDVPTLTWKIIGTLISLSSLILNVYQMYSSYYRCKYELGWDISKYLEESKDIK